MAGISSNHKGNFLRSFLPQTQFFTRKLEVNISQVFDNFSILYCIKFVARF